jgi:protein transport protein YIF1
MILHPLGVKKSQNWARKSAESDGYDQTTDIRTKWALPRDDTCAPDLYIPLMSFVTYVLLYGLYTGISRPEENAVGYKYDPSAATFSPEVLINCVWRCILVQIIEVIICYVGLNLLNCSLGLDLFAYTGYKYVGLCIGIISRLFGNLVSTIVVLYTSGTLAFFFLKSMASIVPPSSNTDNVTCNRHWVLLSLSAVQFVVAFGLGWF